MPISGGTTIIIGAGIVGSAIAAYLSERSEDKILVLDQSIAEHVGSTGHAPGFVGQLNENKVLTELAIESVRAYQDIPGGFEACGALEIATSESGVAKLQERLTLAKSWDFPANLIDSERARELAPFFQPKEKVIKALHFTTDGVANAIAITATFREKAASNGVTFREAKVLNLVTSGGTVTGVQTESALIPCQRVILATGVWTN